MLSFNLFYDAQFMMYVTTEAHVNPVQIVAPFLLSRELPRKLSILPSI